MLLSLFDIALSRSRTSSLTINKCMTVRTTLTLIILYPNLSSCTQNEANYAGLELLVLASRQLFRALFLKTF